MPTALAHSVTNTMSHREKEFVEPIPAHRRFGISWLGLLLGLILGLSAGLFYTRQIDPIIVRNVSPAELDTEGQQLYVIGVVEEYSLGGDLQQATTKLLEVNPDANPFELAAQTVCDLIRSGAVSDVSDVQVIRNLRNFYEPQGIQADCETAAFNTPIPVTISVPMATITPTPTITPVASKTPTRPFDPTATPVATPTVAAVDGVVYRQQLVERFCDPDNSGVIEVYVQQSGTGAGIPGIAVEVSWSNGQRRQIFYTGLKPERGEGYADFDMTEGIDYRIDLPEVPSEPTQDLDATPCDALGTITSWRVVIFRFIEQ